jgi:hypothetical protein
MPYIPPITPQIARIPAGLGRISLSPVLSDLAAVPPYVADILAAVAAILAQVAPVVTDVVPGGRRLGRGERGCPGNQGEEGHENRAASHIGFLLRSANQTGERRGR